MTNILFFAPNIPTEWRLIPNKYLFISHSKKVGKEFGSYQLLSLTKKGVIAKDINSNEGKLPASFEGYQTVSKNDMIFCLFDLDMSAVFSGLSNLSGMITSAYDVFSLNYNFIDSNYCKYWFDYVFTGRYYKNYSKNIRYTISEEAFGQIKTPIPSLDEQIQIGTVLDKKINQIDELISNQEKQIEKLEEYKQSIITKAVTKGLDPNAKMKDSGVEWIGEIPEDWSTIKIKYTSWLKGRIGWDGLKSTEFIDEGPYLITGTDFKDGSIDWNACVHISEERFAEDELLHIKENDLLITKDGTIGKLAIVKNCPEKVSLNSGVMIIRNTTNFKYVDKYMYYVLKSKQFLLWYELSQAGNSTIRHLYQGQFYNFEFTFPSLEDQNQISKYLDSKCEIVENLIDLKKQKVDELKNYKISLIYEYVTGKKRVI